MDYWHQFQLDAAKLGITLRQEELSLFREYTDLLTATNKKINLTAIKTLPEIITKHYLDSLALLPTVAQTETLPLSMLLQSPWSVIDIGSGGGIPGYPLRFVWPTMHLGLVESIQKKAAFLRYVAETLHLQVQVWAERAEILAHHPEHREHYHLVLARAVAPLNILIEYTLPFARLGGLVVLPKGGKIEDELRIAEAGIRLLGGRIVTSKNIHVPGLQEQRTVIIIRKLRPTPDAYPRRPGIPSKRPLVAELLP